MTHILRFWQVDAFTERAFAGNPAAVFVLDEALDDRLMQSIAIEMNQSETAFLLIRKGKAPLLRWFTPTFEIDLCGHATLASAHVFLTHIAPEAREVTFDTQVAGRLKVERSSLGYRMDFPSRPGDQWSVEDVPSTVLNAITPNARPHTAYKSRDLMLVYDDPDLIRGLAPDFSALANYDHFIIVTAPSDRPEYDFLSRFFCADDGIAEDPVTGSAHCTLAPYWAKRLAKRSMTAYQASRRGGELSLELTEDRVLISGAAVTVIEGTLTV